jgi:Signal transduction histidine kinase
MNDLSLHIIDIIQNSISAGATLITLVIIEDIDGNLLTIIIEDNGRGMSSEQVQRLSDPFFTTRTTRKVGMGIPLFRQSAEQSGGGLVVESTVGVGTKVTATFIHDNIDRPPLGDVANSFILMVSANPQLDFLLRYVYNGEEYIFDTIEIKEVLDGMPLNNPSVIKMLTEMVRNNIQSA